MRLAAAFAASLVVGLAGSSVASAQAPQGAQCANANAMGLARTVEVDTATGPGFGFEQYKMHDFLRLKEVVLTFDDGPWPNNTRAVLEALAQQCVKATFFPIGKHALYHPEILKEVAAAGHSVGGHTWSHANLAKGKGDNATEEIEKGFSAIKIALGANPTPFFRFPYLQDPEAARTYLGTRGIAMFSHDLDIFDFKTRKPEDLVKTTMARLEKKGKGILLMHDFQAVTAKAMPELLRELQAKGYKVVHMKAKASLTTLPQWDDAAKKEVKGVIGGSDAPTSSVIRTIDETNAQTVTSSKK
jgi:peptidoglycan-N-acetylglucosamine deacetylase